MGLTSALNNISNAATEGFARREISLSADNLNGYGGGVRVTDVARIENVVLSSARREAEAAVSSLTITTDFTSRFAVALGNPEDVNSLAVQYANLESSLIASSNRPSDEILLGRTVDNARDVSETLNSLSNKVNDLRLEADQEIGKQVSAANSILSQLSDLNVDIRARTINGGSTASLKDQQSQLLDQLNLIIPTKVATRDFGGVAIFTPTGGTLLDGRVTQLSFASVPAMSHNMTSANGSLSDLIVDGNAVAMNSGNGFFNGGSLASLFEARDILFPKFNNEIDGLAVDLISRFQNPSVDPTLAPTDPGLFHDNGGQFLIGNELGLAGRVGINASVDPLQGGQVWRLRDGLNATIQGDVGINSTLRNYLGSFQATQSPAVGMSVTNSQNANRFVEQFSAAVSKQTVSQEDQLVFERQKSGELHEAELSVVGVDTDAELQSLMEVESAYAANARVVSVLDELINRLLEI